MKQHKLKTPQPGDTVPKSSKGRVVKEEGDDKEKKPVSKKALLDAATPNVDLEAIAQAGATIIGKGYQKGRPPADCPEGHKKWYVLVSVLAVLLGEQLKKRLNGVQALDAFHSYVR